MFESLPKIPPPLFLRHFLLKNVGRYLMKEKPFFAPFVFNVGQLT